MRRLSITIMLLIIFDFCLLFGILEAEEAESFKVLVNASNPIVKISKSQLSYIFLKKDTRWDNGQKIYPVDQALDSPVRRSFSREIHDLSPEAVKGYWTKMIFSGRDVPPTVKVSDREVINYVKENPDAIGYTSATAPVEGVKVVEIF